MATIRKKIIVGSRASRLAIAQVEEIKKMLSCDNVDFVIKTYNTTGDIDKNTPISKMEGTDFFTDAIEKAIQNDEVDIGIHSAKDLPDVIPNGLVVAALTDSIDPYDAVVSKRNLKIEDLPKGAKIGTCSIRRKEQLKKFRPDFEIVDIRGNIEERLEKLYNSDLEAIVIAAAALVRLGLEEKITQRIPFDIVNPHPLQGSIAVETKYMKKEIIELFNKIDRRKKILFLSIENSLRSQIAEAIVNHFYWQKCFALSAGLKPKGVIDQLAIEVMKEKAVDISHQKSKNLNELPLIKFDYIITMGDCKDVSSFSLVGENIVWQIPDTKGKPIEFLYKIRDEIENKIVEFINNMN